MFSNCYEGLTRGVKEGTRLRLVFVLHDTTRPFILYTVRIGSTGILSDVAWYRL